MEIKNAAALLQRMAESSGNQYRDVQLSVRIFKPGMIGGTPCVPVKRLDQGFDWDAGKVLITPDVELTTLTAEEVADIRTSVAAGQSWHAYQVQKKLRDERDALAAKVEELEQTIAANALGQAAELFGWAYGLGGFDVAVLEFVKFVRSQVLQQLAPELERYDIQGGDGNGVYPDKDKDGEWCKAEDALAGLAVRDARIAELEAELAESRKCAEIMQQGAFSYQAELAAIKAQEPVAYISGCYRDVIGGKSDRTPLGAELAFVNMGWIGQIPLYAAPVSEAKAQGVVIPELSAAEREDLLEFHQSVCCDAGHRVEKSGMKRLSEIGAVESCGFGKHRLTEFGVYLLGLNAAPAAPAADAGHVFYGMDGNHP